MKNKFIKKIATLVMLAIASVGTIYAQFAGGDGSRITPFKIATPAHLDAVRNHLSAHFVVVADLDMSSISPFTPIGSDAARFTGSFDGGGFVISNLTITTTTAERGLFAVFAPAVWGDAIQNVVIRDSRITIAANSGALVGSLHNGIVQDCEINARVVSTGNMVGGIVGRAFGTSIIRRCWFGDTLSGTGSNLGGIVGTTNNNSLVTDCYTTGHVEAITTRNYAGGIVATVNNNAIVQNCYSTASVRANRYTGGIVAMNSGNPAGSSPTVQNNVAINRRIENVTTASGDAHRLIGQVMGTNGIIRGNYALQNMQFFMGGTLQTTLPGDSLNGINGLSKTLTELQTQATYTTAPMDWDFNSVWRMDVGTTEFPVFTGTPRVDSVRFTEAEIEISKEVTVALNWTVYPAAADQTVFFQSSDEDVVIVTDAGVITSVEDGTAQVTIFAGSKTDKVTITVISTQVNVDSVRFVVSGLELEMIDPTDTLTLSRRDTLKWAVYPENATNKTVTVIPLLLPLLTAL
jgi:hypothetical protein